MSIQKPFAKNTGYLYDGSMEPEPKIRFIPEKDVDSFSLTLFLRVYFRILAPLLLILPLAMGLRAGIAVAVLVCLPAAGLVVYFCDGTAVFTQILFGYRRAIVTPREQMESTLKTAKIAKMGKKYQKALDIVNRILDQDPEFDEALLVKAQILFEGYKNIEGAKGYCERSMAAAGPGSSVYNWSESFLKQLVSEK